MTRLDVLVEMVQQFRDQHFPEQAAKSAAAKVVNEALELENNPGDRVEAADVLITLISWCEASGIVFNDELIEVAIAKMVVNRARKWQIQPDGTAQHV